MGAGTQGVLDPLSEGEKWLPGTGPETDVL